MERKPVVKQPWLSEAAIRLLEGIIEHGTSGNAAGAEFLALSLARLFIEQGYKTAAERIRKAINGEGTKLVLVAADEQEMLAAQRAIREVGHDKILKAAHEFKESLGEFTELLAKAKPKREAKKGPPRIPALTGQDIYVPSQMYISHGADDFLGGLCRVQTVKMEMSAGELVPFVEVMERPGHFYNWEILKEDQDKLRKEYGKRRGRPDPDNHPDSNEGF